MAKSAKGRATPRQKKAWQQDINRAAEGPSLLGNGTDQLDKTILRRELPRYVVHLKKIYPDKANDVGSAINERRAAIAKGVRRGRIAPPNADKVIEQITL